MRKTCIALSGIGWALEPAFIALALPPSALPSRATVSVPGFARLMGVTVGKDTVETLNKRLGKGLIITGMHPQGARLWRDRKTGWIILADSDTGGVSGTIAQLNVMISIKAVEERSHIPVVSFPRKMGMLYGEISLGMNTGTVRKRLDHLGVKYTIKSNVISWKSGGSIRQGPNVTYDSWGCDLNFRRDRLGSIVVFADYTLK